MEVLSGVRLAIYIIALITIVCCIAGLMEIYKKTIRKRKAKSWENYSLALILSILSLLLLKGANIFHPALVLIGGKEWIDWIVYVIVVYFAQFQVDKKIIKKIIKSLAENVMEKAGLDEDQIKDILSDK